jgi:hypothetical protein
MNLTQQLKNQKEQNAKIVAENFNLIRKVEELETKIVKTEWQPKRGDRVLVSNFNDNELEKIFVTKIEGAHYPIVAVHSSSENDFYNNLQFNTSCYKQMKPLPKETDFKTKIIELIEKRIENQETNIQQYYDSKQYHLLNLSNTHKIIYQDLLNQIKQL